MKRGQMTRQEIAEYKFRPLKKKLNKEFANIRNAIALETLPTKSNMDTFIELVHIMVTYSGFGDEYYDIFFKSCLDLQKAFKNKDVISFEAAYESVLLLKKSCHKKYCL